MIGTPGVAVRLHGATLYSSIYRFDDDMIVNMHVYGRMAPQAPAMHLRQLTQGSLFEMYTQTFDDIWDAAAPYPKEVGHGENRVLQRP
ncbi:hypothetical protein ACWIGI_19365 [Nocardia sp. NPDC055321]